MVSLIAAPFEFKLLWRGGAGGESRRNRSRKSNPRPSPHYRYTYFSIIHAGPTEKLSIRRRRRYLSDLRPPLFRSQTTLSFTCFRLTISKEPREILTNAHLSTPPRAYTDSNGERKESSGSPGDSLLSERNCVLEKQKRVGSRRRGKARIPSVIAAAESELNSA